MLWYFLWVGWQERVEGSRVLAAGVVRYYIWCIGTIRALGVAVSNYLIIPSADPPPVFRLFTKSYYGISGTKAYDGIFRAEITSASQERWHW